MNYDTQRPRPVSATPFRSVAIQTGRLERGRRDMSGLPLDTYRTICRALNDIPRVGRGINEGIMRMVAEAVLSQDTTIRCSTFICVSDYVGGVRYQKQNQTYALTPGEREVRTRIQALGRLLESIGYRLEWHLILADAWGLELYPERLQDGAIDAYCAFMQEEFGALGTVHRWSTTVGDPANADQVDRCTQMARSQITDRMRSWEMAQGEIAHDKPGSRETARRLAQRHMEMRAIEGKILTDRFGPMIVLSTEARGARRYDNLLVPHHRYSAVNWMPLNPHRL